MFGSSPIANSEIGEVGMVEHGSGGVCNALYSSHPIGVAAHELLGGPMARCSGV